MLKIVIRNIVSNWLGFAVQAAVAFFLTPFILRSLGETRYGVWALVTGLTGYYGLLDLGFRAGITQYLTRHLATRDFNAMNRTASTALVALSACGGLIVLASTVLSRLAPLVFNIPLDAIAETRLCILVIGCSTALQFVFFPFSAVFAATQRYDMSNMIGVGTRLATACATLAALNSGYGLVGLCVVNAAGDILGYVIRWRIAHRILPELRVSLRLAARQHLWPIATFGLWNVLAQGAIQLKSYSSSLVIGLFLPVSAIAPFSLAIGLVAQFEGIFRPVAIVFFPAATHLDARGDVAGLQRMYLVGSKMLLLLAIALGAIGAVWAEDFFRLWVGPRLVDGGKYTSIVVLFWVLLGAVIAVIGQKIGLQVLMAARRLKGLTMLLVAEALANLFLSVCLIRPLGLLGVAVGILLPAALFQGVLLPVIVCRFLRIPAWTYLGQVYLRPLVVGGILFPMLVLLRYTLPSVDRWRMLFGEGLIAVVVAGMLTVAIGLDTAERRRFIWAPVIRLLCRLGFHGPLDSRVKPL